MQSKEYEIGDIAYFHFAANDNTGTGADGATPLYDVRLCGAAANAAPTAEGTPTLLTHANYSNGVHEIAIDTAGWAAGEYAVFCTLTVSSVNPSGFCGSFKLRAIGTSAYGVLNHADYGNAKLVRSTTPANTLAVDAAGKVDATGTASDPWSTSLPGSYAAGTAGAIVGGITSFTGGSGDNDITLVIQQTDGTIIADCNVVIRATNDVSADPITNGKTDSFGIVQPHPQLDSGTYYAWRSKDGLTLANPQEVIVP